MQHNPTPAARRTSYYDKDQDIYHLTSKPKENRSNPTIRMNNKETILSSLENELLITTTKLQEAQARIRFHENSRRSALELQHAKHLNHVEKIKLNTSKHLRLLKTKLSKAEKQKSLAVTRSEQCVREVSVIQTALTDVTRSKGRTMSEIENLSGRVRLLNESLTESNTTIETERSHSSQLDRNLHEIGKQLELVVIENKRLHGVCMNEEKTRDTIISMHGEQLYTISETLDLRTKQLNETEIKLTDCRLKRDGAITALENYREGHGITLNDKDALVLKIRAELNTTKDLLSESKRQSNVDGGTIIALNNEIQNLKNEISDKNNRISSTTDQLGMEKLTEQQMQQRIAELENQLSQVNMTHSQQNERHNAAMVTLKNNLHTTTLDVQNEKNRNHLMENELNEKILNVKEKQLIINNLNVQISTLENALKNNTNNNNNNNSSSDKGATTINNILPSSINEEINRLNQIILSKDSEIMKLNQQLKEQEAEIARRTLRAAGMAANKITEEKKRMLEETNTMTNQYRDEINEKNRLLNEKENELKLRDTIEQEKLKWQQQQEEKDRKDMEDLKEAQDMQETLQHSKEDSERQERWLLMQRMKEMEENMDQKKKQAQQIKIVQRTNQLYENIDEPEVTSSHVSHGRHFVVPSEQKMENESFSSSATMPTRKMVNVDKLERKNPEAMDDDMREHLKSLVNRCDALRDEYEVHTVGSPELIARVETLTLELAERISIESYDVGEHLFEIMDDMSPILRSSTLRQKSVHARQRDISDAKNTIAAAMSVARSRVRAALHLSRDGVLYWLLSLYGNVASLLQSLRKPELSNYDTHNTALSPKGKKSRKASRKKGVVMNDDPNVIVASRDLVKVCSNQWTERRWPSESSGILNEVRAAVEKAAEDEYWRRYAEAMSNGKHVTGERDSSSSTIEDSDANKLFWELLDPLSNQSLSSKIEKRIWNLLTLVSEQQVTETLGEIRLRRQDIHRKLLDTSMYAAILRFVCYGRDMSELSIVIDQVAGNQQKASSKGGKQETTMFKNQQNRKNEKGKSATPFVASNRRNTIIGKGKEFVQVKKKRKKVGISKKNGIKVRDTLRNRSGGELRKLMRQSDQRGIVGEFEMTLNDVKTSIQQKERVGSIFEDVAVPKPVSNITKKMVASIKSPELKRRLLRHVKPSYD